MFLIAIIVIVGFSVNNFSINTNESEIDNAKNVINVEGVTFNIPTDFEVNNESDGFYNNENKSISIYTADYTYDNPQEIDIMEFLL